ncbi:hypothetical protein scyTo_0001442 [Scyliorhinus torazame]|uniref:Inositol polyphosphate-related phosphatase domain-containing protein n=1 Tax=Scyliorhinus torazame TaxID=75743 RepID=A0A401PD34_SCYTO|nr:hypothetical protein [Scyliorhinus torazame]
MPALDWGEHSTKSYNTRLKSNRNLQMMAVKTPAQGTGVLLTTANVGSLFEDPESLQKNWLREFYQTVHTHKPHFIALHCQEVGGKNYEASMSHVDKFVKELLSSDEMKEYNRARVYLDENYKSQEHFTQKLDAFMMRDVICFMKLSVLCSIKDRSDKLYELRLVY